MIQVQAIVWLLFGILCGLAIGYFIARDQIAELKREHAREIRTLLTRFTEENIKRGRKLRADQGADPRRPE